MHRRQVNLLLLQGWWWLQRCHKCVPIERMGIQPERFWSVQGRGTGACSTSTSTGACCTGTSTGTGKKKLLRCQNGRLQHLQRCHKCIQSQRIEVQPEWFWSVQGIGRCAGACKGADSWVKGDRFHFAGMSNSLVWMIIRCVPLYLRTTV